MNASLVIPAYNEEKRLKPFLDSIAAFSRQNPEFLGEIIVVNDGSSDATGAVVRAFQSAAVQPDPEKQPTASAHLPNLKLIEHEKNQGKGAAVRTGIMSAQGDIVVFMDADGAAPITELPKILTALQTADMAVGNRWLPGAHTIRHSALRRLSGFIYRTYMRLFGLGRIDTMCGFKGFRRATARRLFQNLQEPGWLFDTEICYQAIRIRLRIINFPIQWESKDGSKLGTTALLKSSLQIWPLIRRLRRSAPPDGDPERETRIGQITGRWQK